MIREVRSFKQHAKYTYTSVYYQQHFYKSYYYNYK